jgi:hypothetical protein
METKMDGPATSCFAPVQRKGDLPWSSPNRRGQSEAMARAAAHAPIGEFTAWGIPFETGSGIWLMEEPVSVPVEATMAKWLVFLHSADERQRALNEHGFYSPMRGQSELNQHVADYVFVYKDGSQERAEVRMRHQVGLFEHRWGEESFQCVLARKPGPMRGGQEQVQPDWGFTQTRVNWYDSEWNAYLWAWENPFPEKALIELRFEPKSGGILLTGISAGNAEGNPLRWRTRRKALLRLDEGEKFTYDLDPGGLLAQIQLDMGQVISALPRLIYPTVTWPTSYDNQLPQVSEREVVIEYTSHPDASFHVNGGQIIPVSKVEKGMPDLHLSPVAPAEKRVSLKVIDKTTRKPVSVKLHIHGQAGEYLPPVDRHRILNTAWFEDYSVDFAHQNLHPGTYINGETLVNLPLGKVYLEVSKGFEVRPVRTIVEISSETDELVIEMEKVLPWRERGWVTADTHVHFLSPVSAMLEGAGEGVNVVNLLASQWGELMTNVGDFDGRNTWGEQSTGGGPEANGEYLVRVGTENRQHVLGHISLLGYQGRIIAPMTVGGPDEAALGDPIDILLTEWARQCKAQGGLVVLPHFPNPRAEHAASLVEGEIDAVEMTSWGDHYNGIDPYSLSDWYRFLNCGYMVPAVGGTDKMWSGVAVGTVRTYARTNPNVPFTYSAWMEAVRRGETFVSYGPLVEFTVEGKPAGSAISFGKGGGTVDVTWQVASVTIPTTRIDLIVNGEIKESQALSSQGGTGTWNVKIEKSCWLAVLVRGGYPDQKEMIAAHSSPVQIQVQDSPLLGELDAVSILDQIEGAMAFLDTVGTRAEDAAYKRMRMVLTSAHRNIHNRLHQKGVFHDHTVTQGHD